MNVKTIMTYQCPICREKYKTKKGAQECLDIGMEKPIASVGDIVELDAGYGWFDGDKRWIINPSVKLRGIKSHGNCFEKCCTYAFYYVITKIENDIGRHKLKYHVYTNAMTLASGHSRGFTFTETHITPKIAQNVPKFVIKNSKKLIGKDGKYLL